MRARMRIRPLVVAALVVAFHASANGRTSLDWTAFGRDAQHTAVSGASGRRPLHETLQQLNLMPATTAYLGHAVRRLGNEARHVHRLLDPNDTQLAVAFLEQIAEISALSRARMT